MRNYCSFSDHLSGKIITSIEGFDNDHVIIKTECGKTYQMHHNQACCEHVSIVRIHGTALNVIDSIVGYANSSEMSLDCDDGGQRTRTMFTLRTENGSLTIVWEGHSNGYYSTGVAFYEEV